MVKKFTKVLFALVTVLAVSLMSGCTNGVGPDLGSLKGGPRPVGEIEPSVPEAEIVIYDVKLGVTKAADQAGRPGTTIALAAPGYVFLGEDATAADASNLAIGFAVLETETVEISYAVVNSPSAAAADVAEWTPVYTDGAIIPEAVVIADVFPSGSYLVFEVTDLDNSGAKSYYKYLVAWGRNNAGLESITIAGRTFTNLGTPYVGSTEDDYTGVANPTIYLTAAQIVAGRPIEANLRADSQTATVLWGPTWPTNNTTPAAAFVRDPINTVLANNSRIFIRVVSVESDVYANYRLTVAYANNGVLGTFTAGKGSVSGAANLGTPRGSWNAAGLVDGTAIPVKSSRLADAIATHTGGNNPGTVTWAFVPDLETEPVFVALDAPQTLAVGGYVYVKTLYQNNYSNVYRFPISSTPLSSDAAVSAIKITDTAVNLGTPAATWEAALAGPVIVRLPADLTPPVVSVTPVDPDVDLHLLYGVLSNTDALVGGLTSTIPNIVAGQTLVIKNTSEDETTSLFYRIKFDLSPDAAAASIKVNNINAQLGTPNAVAGSAVEGSITIYNTGAASSISPPILVDKYVNATVKYAKTPSAAAPGSFDTAVPTALQNGNYIWVEVTAENGVNKLVYKIKVGLESGPPPLYNPLPTFDINNLPTPAWWNQQAETLGEFMDYPNPFVFADGSPLLNPADWPERRREIEKIVQHYWTGYYPPQPTRVSYTGGTATKTGDTWTLTNTVITVEANGRSATFSYNAPTLPANQVGPNGLPIGPDNPIPMWVVGTNAALTNNGWATLNFTLSSDNMPAGVNTLFSYANSDDNRPSALVADAWVIARIIDALELTVAEDGQGPLWGGLIAPDKLGTTGHSRDGKKALHIGAFAESMKGTRFGVTWPNSSGSGGVAVDRFVAQAGGRYTGYDYINLDSGGSPFIQLVPADTAAATGRTVVHFNRSNSGFQSLTHTRGEQSIAWVSNRIQGFADNHREWILNYQSATNPTSADGWHGIMSSAPFDAHFLTSLVAPRILYIADGWESAWTNAEGNYMNYLLTKEVYDFLGVPESIGIRNFRMGHATSARSWYEIVDMSNHIWNKTEYRAIDKYKPVTGTYAKITAPTASAPTITANDWMDADDLFDATNPRTAHLASWIDPAASDPGGYQEYLKLKWANPLKPQEQAVGNVVKQYFIDNGLLNSASGYKAGPPYTYSSTYTHP
ncbi:hypothetical protein AGMMS49991_09520 [Spirochaetia bacterium]|nr:hypothetical protein AGMMS49991_09520 [Spirochaetia bacterium]